MTPIDIDVVPPRPGFTYWRVADGYSHPANMQTITVTALRVCHEAGRSWLYFAGNTAYPLLIEHGNNAILASRFMPSIRPRSAQLARPAEH